MNKYENENELIIENLKKYITEFDSLQYGVVVVKNDEHSTLIYANSIYYDSIGYTKEELLEKFQNRIADILVDKVYDPVKINLTKGNYDMVLDLRLRTHSGGILWGHNLAHYDSKLNVFFIAITDITDKMVESTISLSFDAFQVRNSILAYVSKYTSENIIVSDVETDEIIYMNPSAIKLSGLNNEIDWQGKTFCDIAFGGKEKAHKHYLEPLTEEFTSREYYNSVHNYYVNAKNKLLIIPNINRNLRLTILKDISIQKRLEQRILTQEALSKCIETLFESTSENDMSGKVYYDILLQLSIFYKAKSAFFYKLADNTHQLENVYRVVDNKIVTSNLTFPISITIEQSQLLHEVSNLSLEESSMAIDKFGDLYISSLKQFNIGYDVNQFSCITVNDENGEIIAFMGVTNPTENTKSKQLMDLLSRFMCMFIAHRRDQKLTEEAITLENTSKTNVVEKSIKNFQDVTHYKENICDVLNALCEHYNADFAMILYQNKNSDTYGIHHVAGSLIPNLSTFQNQPKYAMDKWKETFELHSQYATDKDIESLVSKKILKEQFGIYNFIATPLRGKGDEVLGIMFISNYKLKNRSHLLANGISKHIGDYIEKVNTEGQSKLNSSSLLVNKVDAQNKISEILKNEQKGTMFIINIDNFRNLNETLGFYVGDTVLIELMESLKQMFRHTDFVSRIGGDTFVVFSPSLVLSDAIEKKASQIISRCHHYYNKDGISVAVSVSVGICPVDAKCTLYPALYENAEYALYIAKKSGKNCYHVFSETEYSKNTSMNKDLRYLPNAVKAIKTALENNDFVVHYQPLYHVPSGTYTHAEALVRMKNSDGTLVYPNDFIEVAEKTGLVVEMTYQILEQVCKDFRNLLDEHPQTTLETISVNLPYLQFTDPRMESHFIEILNKYNILPQQIKLEITERIIANDMDLVLNKMSNLNEKGFDFSLDDFGTDYSNLKMCLSLPLDVIKLDRSLLLAASQSEKDRRFFKHLILGLHDSNRFTIMEGVETKEQLDWTTECGCDFVQGYYFSKPVDFDNFKNKLIEQLPEKINYINKTYTSTKLMQLDPQAIVVLDTKNNEISFVNDSGKNLLFYDKVVSLENLNKSLMHSVYDDVIKKELKEKGKSVLQHVCIKSKESIAKRYDIHIAYVDDTRDEVCLVFAISELELQRISKQSNYYRTVSDAVYSYPFHLDVKKRRIEFFNSIPNAIYNTPMVMENFPDPLFDYPFIYEEDIEEYKLMIQRMYKGEHPQGSIRFYDPKGELLRYNVNYVVNRDQEGEPVEVNGDFIIQSPAQNTLEYKINLQDAVHECMDILFTVGASSSNPKGAYTAVINKIKEYYHAEGAYFYEINSVNNTVERIYTALDDNLKDLELSSPTMFAEQELQLMQLLLNTDPLEIKNQLSSFGQYSSNLLAIKDKYKIEFFSCVDIKNIKGEIIAYVGVINPKHHKYNKELLELLSRPVSMFIEFQKEQRMKHELIKLEAHSKADVVKECIENFREFTNHKEHISKVLDSLCSHYDADFAVVLTADKDKKEDYILTNMGGTKIPNFENLEKEQTEAMKKWKLIFQKGVHYITDCEVDNPKVMKFLKDKYGIYNFIAAPIQDENGILTGLLYVGNYKTLGRSNLLTHIVANNISDYLDRIHMYIENNLEPLTKLLNKMSTQDTINKMLDSGVTGVLFSIDLDHFKDVNDILGHVVGDEVIIEVANMIKNTFRGIDIVGRVGGDEFMVFCPNPIEIELVKTKAKLICDCCNKIYKKDDRSVNISASVGVLCINEQGKTFQDVYDEIDKTLYIAKNRGKNQYHIENM